MLKSNVGLLHEDIFVASYNARAAFSSNMCASTQNIEIRNNVWSNIKIKRFGLTF